MKNHELSQARSPEYHIARADALKFTQQLSHKIMFALNNDPNVVVGVLENDKPISKSASRDVELPYRGPVTITLETGPSKEYGNTLSTSTVTITRHISPSNNLNVEQMEIYPDGKVCCDHANYLAALDPYYIPQDDEEDPETYGYTLDLNRLGFGEDINPDGSTTVWNEYSEDLRTFSDAVDAYMDALPPRE